MIGSRRRWALLAAAVFFCASAAPAPQKVIARIDLSRPFHLPRGATFTATQGPEVDDPTGFDDDKAPGQIRLCLQPASNAPCALDLNDMLSMDRGIDMFSEIHFLQAAEILYPRGRTGPPLFYLQVGSFLAGDSDQIRGIDIIAYRPRERRFSLIFHKLVGTNNNQQVRYIGAGPLKGDVITVQPTGNAPYGYWVTVDRLTPDYGYEQVLRYRSATHYNDGNPLGVTDSEMPNILGRLHLWHPGEPLPLPKSGCPHPHLVKTELWCS